MVWSYDGRLFSHKKEQSTDTHYNLDKSCKQHVKGAQCKRPPIILFHLHEMSRIGKSIEIDRKHISVAGVPKNRGIFGE